MSITQSNLGVTISNPGGATSCCCSVKLTLFYEGEVSYITLFRDGCAGFDVGVWQEYDHVSGSSWVDIEDTSTTIPQEVNKSYRYKVTKEGCCITYSNLIPSPYFIIP